MFALACWSGRRQGSLFAGALVGCFVVYAYFWGGWFLSCSVRKLWSKRVQGIELTAAMFFLVACFALSVILPNIVLSFVKCLVKV